LTGGRRRRFFQQYNERKLCRQIKPALERKDSARRQGILYFVKSMQVTGDGSLSPREGEAVTGLTTRKEITVIREGERIVTGDEVVVETPLTIYLNGEELVTLLCTPDKMESLALGFLRSEGLLTSLDDVVGLRLREDGGAVEVELKNKSVLAEKLYGRRTITSGCGKGTVFFSALDALRSRPVSGDTVSLTADEIRSLMKGSCRSGLRSSRPPGACTAPPWPTTGRSCSFARISAGTTLSIRSSGNACSRESPWTIRCWSAAAG
jgi:hypothetical protein